MSIESLWLPGVQRAGTAVDLTPILGLNPSMAPLRFGFRGFLTLVRLLGAVVGVGIAIAALANVGQRGEAANYGYLIAAVGVLWWV